MSRSTNNVSCCLSATFGRRPKSVYRLCKSICLLASSAPRPRLGALSSLAAHRHCHIGEVCTSECIRDQEIRMDEPTVSCLYVRDRGCLLTELRSRFETDIRIMTNHKNDQVAKAAGIGEELQATAARMKCRCFSIYCGPSLGLLVMIV